MTQFSVTIVQDEDGYYAHVPALQGCYAQGDTFEETLENIRDVAKLYPDELAESGEEISKAPQSYLTTIEICGYETEHEEN